MKAEQLVCPYCQESVQDAGVVKVETGVRQFQSFYYHPDAHSFMFEQQTGQSNSGETLWQCRACGRELPREITEYINQHAAW
jgi:DNA-directed RNA polymerase subunit RPC12/RpoP